MTFVWPWMLITLFLIPLFVGGYILLRRRRQRATIDLGPMRWVQDGAGRSPGRQRPLPALLLLTGLPLLLVGLARPQMYVDLPRVEGTVILAFDVSNSMAADDLEPTRL